MIVIRVVVVLVIALLAALLGTWIADDAGYVVIGFQGWEIATTVWAAVTAVLVLSLAVYFLVRLLNLVLLRNTKIADWFSAKRSLSSQRQTLLALEAETNGNTIEAIRLLVAAGQQSPNPILHFLRASELAERIGATEKAVELRSNAAKLGDGELLVFRRLNDALELLKEQDRRGGLRALRRLLEDHPNCAPALLALIRNCHEIGDWIGALEYLNVLSRLSFVADEEIYELYITSWIGRIRQVDPLKIANVWHAVPRKLKQDPAILGEYVDALRAKGDITKAVHELERAVNRRWNSQLVIQFGKLEGDAEKQLKTAEGWMVEHRDDAALHLTVGRLHLRLQHTEDARRHIERGVSLGGDVGAKFELAELYAESGDIQRARELFSSIDQELAGD
ncbi:MAG: tetratricopeptide repeat protein [Gammaproteobacteria bacterium]|nr:tetratricopeptide repeat protein [Gammaproteobacteria bacterium]